MHDPQLFIPSPLRTIYKQPGPTVITPTTILRLLYDKDSTHDLSNAKQMAKKRILIGKTDRGAAYLWIGVNATTTLTCI